MSIAHSKPDARRPPFESGPRLFPELLVEMVVERPQVAWLVAQVPLKPIWVNPAARTAWIPPLFNKSGNESGQREIDLVPKDLALTIQERQPDGLPMHVNTLARVLFKGNKNSRYS